MLELLNKTAQYALTALTPDAGEVLHSSAQIRVVTGEKAAMN
jgi:hypothetical protein